MTVFKNTLIALAIGCLALPGFAQDKLELVKIDVEELADAGEQSAADDWLDIAETGERLIEGLDYLMKTSPDGSWLLLGKPVEGLDVVTYELFLVPLASPKLISLSGQALDAVFSPTSELLFVATGPNPIIYDLRDNRGIIISNIQSGLENYPVWVSSWSEDGMQLVVHQQLRFDDRGEPRVWKITLN